MDNAKKLKQLKKILDEVEAYGRCIGKVDFDMQCCAPPDGMERAGEDMAVLGKQIHKLTHSKKYVQLVRELHDDGEGLTPVQKKMVEHLYENWLKTCNQSAKFAYEMDVVFGRAYSEWLAAKKASDFSKFAPSLEKTIDFTRRAIDLRDRKYPTYYNACLDDYEKGGSEQQLDAFFSALKERIVPLVKRIQAEGKPIRDDFLTRPCPIARQEEFVTTHYYKESFVSNICTTLHEGGHALFMQNEPEEFYAEHADDNMSNAMHECISRFYENLIGRSGAFVHFVYPKFMEIAGDIFGDVSERELYEAMNIAKPGLNRCDSDELTYSLHILIRYELEKAFINEEISVDEIPALWNAKYKEYLGVDVPNDAEGCLQDVHWTMSYGYFPSYALGNAYGAQILNTMMKEFDVYAAVEKGDFAAVLKWLKERVFSIASISTPDEWIRAITGEGLNTDYFLDYLEKKFTALYGLK